MEIEEVRLAHEFIRKIHKFEDIYRAIKRSEKLSDKKIIHSSEIIYEIYEIGFNSCLINSPETIFIPLTVDSKMTKDVTDFIKEYCEKEIKKLKNKIKEL